LALLCNGRMIFGAGDGAVGGFDELGGAAIGRGELGMGMHVRFLALVSHGRARNRG